MIKRDFKENNGDNAELSAGYFGKNATTKYAVSFGLLQSANTES